MIIKNGPSILGSKAITNTRPSSSLTRLRPFNQLDNRKISKRINLLIEWLAE
jgi:hypothetical protein